MDEQIHLYIDENLLTGRESYGRKVYQPDRILVLVREELAEEAIEAPFNSLLTENVINVCIQSLQGMLLMSVFNPYKECY